MKQRNLLPLFLVQCVLALFFSGCTPEVVLEKPVLTTSEAHSVTEAAALSGGSIASNGGTEVTARGICWSTLPNPTISDNTSADSSGIAAFTCTMRNLSPSTTYYVRAYATNKNGTGYGPQVVFTTKSFAITTVTPYFVMAQSAISGGYISTDVDSLTINVRGVCWNTYPNPTIADSVTKDGNGKGAFTSTLTGLKAFTTYYMRSYVTSSSGTKYGPELNFTTQNGIIGFISEPVTSITTTSAKISGSITGDGGAVVTGRGFCWATSDNPTIADNALALGSGLGTFGGTIAGLSPGTNYRICSYATNSVGTCYGEESTFTTDATMASVTTSAVKDITSNLAVTGGFVTSDGSALITARGVCWSLTANPTVSLLTKTIDGTGPGAFTSTLASLQFATTYHIRAYVTNSVGTSYGDDLVFTTSPELPILTTNAATSISAIAAVSGGNISSDGGASITSRGICWSTTSNPTTADSKSSSGTGSGMFSGIMTGLLMDKTYYVRAFATNSAGTAYGNEISFTTQNGAITLTTSAATLVKALSATVGGNVASDGGSAVSQRGVCWSTSPNPTLTDEKITVGTGAGTFSSSLSGLSPQKTYYVRAFATNAAGTVYGNEINFTTQNGVITLTTTTASLINALSAASGGSITSDGGASVVARGVCWSSTSNPTTADSKTSNGSGTGTFTGDLTGLLSENTYYVRAYATNLVGTYYGNEVSFKTLNTTGTVTDIDGNLYHYVTIGTQTWMVENLKTTKYLDGSSIPLVSDGTQWSSTSVGGYCNYNNVVNNAATYGRMYNWYAVNDSRKIAPTGWHVASEAEWSTLVAFVGGESVAGGKLKEAGTTHWESPNTGAANSVGFTALPGGYRYSNGTFTNLSSNGGWWTSTVNSTTLAWNWSIDYWVTAMNAAPYPKNTGFSVRCVRDK